MGSVRRSLALVVAAALVCSGVALAERGDPRERITPRDQERARTMLLRPADLRGWTSTPPSTAVDDDAYCRALDESDLTLTGQAQSRQFRLGLSFASSEARVFESLADANASWRRGTSDAGLACLRDLFRNELRRQGSRLVAFGRAAVPRVAPRAARFRIVAETQGVRVHLEMVALMHSRAHATVLAVSGGKSFSKAELDRMSRIVAGRMRTAMRGA